MTLMKKTTAVFIAAALFFMSGAAALTGCGRDKALIAEAPMFDGTPGYHVIVTSGEPEGIAAALAAARNGMATLLIEEGDALGGLFTLGMLNTLDFNISRDGTGTFLTQGIFTEFYDALGNAFDIGETKEWFMRVCSDEPNLTVMLNTEIVAPVMDGKTITGLEIRELGASDTRVVRSLAVIDATVDADVAAAAGAPYTLGGEDRGLYGVKQGVTLVFEVSGVDWAALKDYLTSDESPKGGATERVANGLSSIASQYKSADGNMRFRGPNFARLRNGNVLLNALIIFGVDALDPDSIEEGINRGKAEIPLIVDFMKENFPGFENAELYGFAPRLYVRETRHIIGEYRLTITDVLENRDHWDSIGHGNYPVDIQPTNPDTLGTVVGAPDIYSIPFRSIVPLEIEQLLVVGRSASYDSLPHGSARVVPVGMVTGEAAGTAVAYSVKHGVTFREMSRDPEAIGWLQNQLRLRGAYIVKYDPPRPGVMDHWAYPGVVVMRELGQAGGGYTNNYNLDVEAIPLSLQNRLNRVMAVVNERTADRGEFQVRLWKNQFDPDVQANPLTVGLLFMTVAKAASMGDFDWLSDHQPAPGTAQDEWPFGSAEEARDYLTKRGVLDAETLLHFPDLDSAATNGQMHTVLSRLYLALMG